MIKQNQPPKCLLIDPPDKTPDMLKGQEAPTATEMHEVYPLLGLPT